MPRNKQKDDGAFRSLSLGILVSILAKSQLLASQMAFVGTFLPAFLLSGFMFDIGNMPKALQLVTYLVPARYFITILRGLYLKGVGLSVLWPECLLLTAFGSLQAARLEGIVSDVQSGLPLSGVVLATNTSNTSWGASGITLRITLRTLVNSFIRPTLLCRRPAVSMITTSAPRAFALSTVA